MNNNIREIDTEIYDALNLDEVKIKIKNVLVNIPDLWEYKVMSALADSDDELITLVLDYPLSGLYSLLNNKLTDREKNVIVMRFKYDMKFKEIGEQFDVTTERARQIYNKGMRKMHRLVKRTALPTIEEYIIEKEEMEFLRSKLEFNAQLNDAFQHETIKIEKLGLTTRTYNCLKHEKIETLYDLKNKSVNDLFKIIGMGEKSVDEIVSKLLNLGIKLKTAE